jgi:hypothetical protein
MIRIAGILCGSAVAIAALLLVLGIPEFLPETQPVLQEPVLPEPLQQEAAEPIVVAKEEAEPAEAALPEPLPDSPPDSLPDSLPEPQPTAEPAMENWFAFWSPFRSELAANGFVSELQRSTGMDYRVVRVKPGLYEVAFAYDDDADIQSKLATITAATGLEMPGG